MTGTVVFVFKLKAFVQLVAQLGKRLTGASVQPRQV